MLRRTVDVKLTNENTYQLESILREVGDFFYWKTSGARENTILPETQLQRALLELNVDKLGIRKPSFSRSESFQSLRRTRPVGKQPTLRVTSSR